jgi:hypothetical protein
VNKRGRDIGRRKASIILLFAIAPIVNLCGRTPHVEGQNLSVIRPTNLLLKEKPMGLYDDAAITSGDVSDRDFVNAKVDYERLEDALKLRQSERVVDGALQSLNSSLETALKSYPDHEEVKKWKARSDEIGAKISKDPQGQDETPKFRDNWGQYVYPTLGNYLRAKGFAREEQWEDAWKTANEYLEDFDFITKDNYEKNPQMTDDWKKRYAAYAVEMKALAAEAKKKK